METDEVTRKIDIAIEEHVRYLRTDHKRKLKKNFENFFFSFLDSELELNLVIDANIIIDAGLQTFKGIRPFIYELADSPHLKLFAPPWLDEELKRRIPEICRKKSLDEKQFFDSIKQLREKITILSPDHNAIIKARELIGDRDPKDIPYIALWISRKAHGTVTVDSDFENKKEITVFKLTGVAKVLTVFENGSFSFSILTNEVPILLRILYEIVLISLRYIWEIVTMIAVAFSAFLVNGLKAMGEGAIPLLLIVIALLYLAKEKLREVIAYLASEIETTLKLIYTFFRNIISFVASILTVAVTSLKVLFINIEKTISEYDRISKNEGLVNA